MDHQFYIINDLGEVTKKRMLFRLDEGYAKNVVIDKQANDDYLSEKFGYVPTCKSLNNTIDNCVNNKCLSKIFTYVPACERPKLALVCKEWKKALDNAWYDVKKLELIYWRYDESPNCLAKYSTSDGGYSFLKSLLNKCGSYLTKLDLTAYAECNIVPVINELCLNLVTLRLRFTFINDVMLYDAFARLSKLKSLTIIFQNIKTFLLLPLVALMNSLRNVANTLTGLNLLNWLNELKSIPDFTAVIKDVIRDLKALKRFECAGIGISADIYKYLAANGILYSNHTAHLKKIIYVSDPFINIKILRMEKCRITDDTLYTIANTFNNLEFLQIKSHWVTDDGVVAISKINNLKTLKFFGRNNITDSSVKLLKNMINLQLPSSNKITDGSVFTVLINSPKMNMLDVSRTNVTAELVEIAADISGFRKQRLTFCVPFMPDIPQYDLPYFDLRIYQECKRKTINGCTCRCKCPRRW